MIPTYFYVQYAFIDNRKLRLFHTLAGIFIVILTITFFSLPVIPALQEVRNLLLLSIISGVLGVVVFILFVIMKRNRLLLFILSIILLRVVFNFTILPIRATDSKHQIQKNIAYKIVEIVQNEPLYIFKKSHFSNIAAFYVERTRGKILTRKDAMNTNDFFIADKSLLKNEHYKVFYKYYLKNTELLLIKLIGNGRSDSANEI
jgi:hypothetical protein